MLFILNIFIGYVTVSDGNDETVKEREGYVKGQ